jgi:hypothetical protein
MTGRVEHNTDGGRCEKEKQSSADQHMKELDASKQTIAMMQAHMDRLERIILTQLNAQQTNVTIANIGELLQGAGGSVSGVSAGIASCPLTGAQEAQAPKGQESEAAAGDGHKPG